MVTVRQAKRAYAEGLFERTTVTDASLSAGQDDGNTIAAGNVAEVFQAEVGEDGELTEYDAVIWGQMPFSSGQTTRAKPTIDIQNSTPADVPAGTQFALAGKKPGTREGKAATRWFNEDNYHAVSIENRDPIEPTVPFILDSQYITGWARNDSTSFTPSFSNSNYELKLMAWDGEGL